MGRKVSEEGKKENMGATGKEMELTSFLVTTCRLVLVHVLAL